MAEALAKNSDGNFECIYLARVPSTEFMFFLLIPYIEVHKNGQIPVSVERGEHSSAGS